MLLFRLLKQAVARSDRGRALNIDTSFGSGVYLPMADGAEYEVTLTQSSLVARPVNPAANAAVARWDGRNAPPPLPQDIPVDNGS